MKAKLDLAPRASCLALALLLLSTLSPQLSTLFAQGSEFTYNGLLNENGNPLNGLVELEATLWDAATNGNQIISVHPLRQMVEVRKGLFTVVLDFGKEAFSGPPRWLQIALRKDPDPAPFTTLWPRQKITAVPYAVTAEEISGKVPIGGLFGAYTNAVAFDNPGNSFAGRGFDLTDLNASQLTSGTVPTAALGNAWKISGNLGTTPGSHFLGTADNQPLEFKVNGLRALRLEPGLAFRPNVIGGFNGNFVMGGNFGSTIGGGGALNASNAIYANYATIAGGVANDIGPNSGTSAIGGGSGNKIAPDSPVATIAGGYLNDIGANTYASAIGGGYDNNIAANSVYATIAGGAQNYIGAKADDATIAGGVVNGIGTNSAHAVIGGGLNNIVGNNAQSATIPGGDHNYATNRAFAAGTRAKAGHTGAFVWADSQDADFASTGNNQFLIRAQGGVGIGTSVPQAPLQVSSAGSAAPQLRLEQTQNLNFARLRFASTTQPFWDVAVGGPNNVMNFFNAAIGNLMTLTTNGNLYVAGTINGTLPGNAVASSQIIDGSISAADVNAPTFSTTFWKTDGNAGTTPGTHFLGTTDNRPLEFKVNGLRALRLEDNGDGYDLGSLPDGAPNVIGGSPANFVEAGVVGAVIGGGGATNYDGLPSANSILGDFGVVGGGRGNRLATYAEASTIAGGAGNNIGGTASGSTIGGGSGNDIAAYSPSSTIAGGSANAIGTLSWYSAIGGGVGNAISGGDSADGANTVAGGRDNHIGTNSYYCAIGGGLTNKIVAKCLDSIIAGGAGNAVGSNCLASAIGGGVNNNIGHNSSYATIPGGNNNFATNGAFATGTRAKANHSGAFVWGDSTPADIASTAANSVTMRASGGYRLFSNSGATLGVNLAPGGGSWTSISDRNAKENFESVDAGAMLEKVAALPLSTWNYKGQTNVVRHIGPMAQDFKAAFSVGESDTGITTVDADGVALAAIQGLNQKLEEQLQARDSEIRDLRQGLAELKETLKNLTTKTQE